jgi:hypothetical protein
MQKLNREQKERELALSKRASSSSLHTLADSEMSDSAVTLEEDFS